MLASARIVPAVLCALTPLAAAQPGDAWVWIDPLPDGAGAFRGADGTDVPSWRLVGGEVVRVDAETIRLAPGTVLRTPIALPPGGGRVRGVVRTRGAGRAVFAVRTGDAITGRLQELRAGFALEGVRPRAWVEVRATEAVELVAVTVEVGWPRIPEPALRAWVEAEWTRLALALEAARDRDGRTTTFLTRVIDPASGAVLARRAAGHHPYFDALLEHADATSDPVAGRRVQEHASDLLRWGLHEGTGLPQLWDGEADRAVAERAVDPGAAWAFLLRCAEGGRLGAEERALLGARAARLCATLERAQRADGRWSSRFVPETGAPAADHPLIRRLRTPSLYARAARFAHGSVDPERALHALIALERHLHWPGTPAVPDPGFDDYFGHLVADAVELAEVFPAEPAFARFVREAEERYAPLWHAARRAGGSCAPDQVRAVLHFLADPERHLAAAEDHWRHLLRTTQLADGAFADVTSVGFEPRLHLPVGDLPRIPFHLTRLTAALLRHVRGGERRAALVTAIAHAWLAVQVEAQPGGYGRGASGADDTARAFVALSELRALLR